MSAQPTMTLSVVRFMTGFLILGLTAAGGKNKGLTLGFGEGFTVVFFGAWLMLFFAVVLPLRASIIIWLLSV